MYRMHAEYRAALVLIWVYHSVDGPIERLTHILLGSHTRIFNFLQYEYELEWHQSVYFCQDTAVPVLKPDETSSMSMGQQVKPAQ